MAANAAERGSLTRRQDDYREVHLLADLGWVDFDLGSSTVFPILLGQIGIGQN